VSDTGNGLVPLSESAGTASEATRRLTVNTGRLRNVVIFGIDDTCDSSRWRETVISALRVATEREVSVDDALPWYSIS